MSISDRLDEIEARANAATDGPWKIETHYGMSQSRRRQIVVPGWMTPIAVLGQENPYGDPDAEFIVASRTDVPALVAALRAVLAIDTGDNRSLYGIDFEAGMCKALAIMHQTIAAALGDGDGNA